MELILILIKTIIYGKASKDKHINLKMYNNNSIDYLDNLA